MNTTQAADFLKMTPGRVRQLARAGILKGYRLGPRAWVFERVELERFAAEERPGPGRPRKGDAPPE